MLKAAPKAVKWFLPIVVIVSLLVSLGYYIISPAPAFAQDDGEQSAQILPDDIEFYLSINLDEIDLGGFIAGEGDHPAKSQLGTTYFTIYDPGGGTQPPMTYVHNQTYTTTDFSILRISLQDVGVNPIPEPLPGRTILRIYMLMAF